MKQVNDFQECLEYVNRLGIVSRFKPIGWRQADLCAIVDKLTWLMGCRYPFKIRYHRKHSITRATFSTVGGTCIVFDYP